METIQAELFYHLSILGNSSDQIWISMEMKLKWWLTPYDLTDAWFMYIP